MTVSVREANVGADYGRAPMSTFLANTGQGLVRPECVLAHRSGRLLVSDWTGMGGVSIIEANGTVHRHLASTHGEPLRPNGIALLPDASILMAHLGAETGGVYRLHPDGGVTPVLTHIDGHVLPPTNFPFVDAEGRLWVTVSTRKRPRASAYRPDVSDGFVVLLDRLDGTAPPRIVADGLGYANEGLVDPTGRYYYVNETFARRLTRFEITATGRLTGRDTVATFGAGTFPDGLAFDEEGGIWVISIVSNRVIRIASNGVADVLFEDHRPGHLDWVEMAYREKRMERQHLDTGGGERLKNVSSIAFGGTDRRRAFLGCLLGDTIESFRSPVAGVTPPHWNTDLTPLMANFAQSP